jgi:hypothetical protein
MPQSGLAARVQKLRVLVRSRADVATRPACARRALRVVLHPNAAVRAALTAAGTPARERRFRAVFSRSCAAPASPGLSASPRGSTPKLLQSLSCLRRSQMMGLSLICEAQEH